MPLARIAVPSILPQHRISALADAVHEGLVMTCPRQRPFSVDINVSDRVDDHRPNLSGGQPDR